VTAKPTEPKGTDDTNEISAWSKRGNSEGYRKCAFKVNKIRDDINEHEERWDHTVLRMSRTYYRIGFTDRARKETRLKKLRMTDRKALFIIYETSSPHGGEYEAQNLLGCTAASLIQSRPTFQLTTGQNIPEDSELRIYNLF
jgi:hypothetical protein